MKFLSIEIKGFRNIVGAQLEASNFANVFIGENGQGKTNFLEALFVLLRGYSFRPFVNLKSIRQEKLGLKSDSTIVKAELADSSGQIFDIKFFLDHQDKMSLLLNEKKITKSQLRKKFSIVAFSPEDHGIIRGGPESRRLFLDQVFGDIDFLYLETLSEFEKVLKHRNRLLKNISENMALKADLIPWNETYADWALKIFQLRKELWPEFTKRVLSQVRELSFSLSQNLIIESLFDLDLRLARGTDTTQKGAFLELLRQEEAKDIATGWTHRGPQRDDFRFLIEGSLDSRQGASQGQARILALALRWAHARWLSDRLGEDPIVLIDDLSSELDAKHRESLLTYLSSQKLQLFISGTDPNLVDSEAIFDYKKYRVFEGKFMPLSGS